MLKTMPLGVIHIGVIHIAIGRWGQTEMLSDVGEWGVNECSRRPVFIFIIKKIGFGPWPDIMLIIYYWQEIFLFDSDLRPWSHPLIIPLHCLWAKSSNRMHGQFECDMTLFLFWLCSFICAARCDFCGIVCLRFQDVQIKQVDCKMSTKNVNNCK